MRVRTATIEDLDKLSVLFEGYRTFYRKTPDYEAARAFLRARIEHQESEIFIAYSADEQLAGFVQLYPIFSSTRLKRLWLLNDLFVDPLYRGQGLSVLLIDAAKALCHRTEACGLMLETAKNNLIGNQLYVQTGFVLDGDHNFYYWDVPATTVNGELLGEQQGLN